MAVLMLPGFALFALVAAWFTRKNLRCPACDAAIQLYGTRYYARSFNCPHCNRALSQ